MRFVQQVALVAETESISFSELTRVSAALQKQASRDLERYWDITATVDPFVSLDDVPPGYWPIIVRDDIPYEAAGIHIDKDGQPLSLVTASDEWSLTASHELLEMLVDPFGNRLIAGVSPMPGQGRVEFLVEVSDPSEDVAFSYHANGVRVSDFYTPRYFDPVAAQGVQYSFTGAIKQPREVLKGGYLSWHEPVSDHWFQMTWFTGNKPTFRDLGPLTARGGIRAQIDALTSKHKMKVMGLGKKEARKAEKSVAMAGVLASVTTAPGTRSGSRASLMESPRAASGQRFSVDVYRTSEAKASALRKQIKAVLRKAK